MASLKYSANSSLQTVTLGAGYTSGSGTMTLTTGHGARLPATGDFWLAYDDGAGTVRLFKVTARSTDTLTVTADATEGSGDGNISSGETLRWALTAAALDQLRGDLHQTGAYASAAAEKAGNIYLPNNSPYLLRDGGASFSHWGPIFNLTPPVNGDFSDLNAPSSVSTTGGALYITSTKTGGDNWCGRIKSYPSAPFTVEIAFRMQCLHQNYRFAALGLYDGTKVKTIEYVVPSIGVRCVRWNSVTSFASGESTEVGIMTGSDLIFLKFEDNNTNWIWSIGTDPNNMQTLLTETRNTFLTPTHIGMLVNNNVSAGRASAAFVHWKQS
jgi:hypothetical protein